MFRGLAVVGQLAEGNPEPVNTMFGIHQETTGGDRHEAMARWVAALSPAVAPDLSALLVALHEREYDAARVIGRRLAQSLVAEEGTQHDTTV
jgi:hypothetical protein